MDKMPSIMQNFIYKGTWKTLRLSDSEIDDLRQLHRKYTMSVMRECVEEAGMFNVIKPVDNTTVACALFEARVEKFFTWVQRALQNKTRKARENGGMAVDEERVVASPFPCG